MRKNSIKNIRINAEVQRELSEILRTGVKDPRVQNALISVTEAEVTPDLKYCKVYISVLGGEEQIASVKEGLKKAMGYIRHELAARINLRNTPELTFILDQSIEYGVRMTKMIDDVSRRDAEIAAERAETEEDFAEEEDFAAGEEDPEAHEDETADEEE